MRWSVLVSVVALTGCEDVEGRRPEPPWQLRPELPSPRLEAAAAANGSRLVIAGGFETGATDTPPLAISREVLQFDPFSETWTQLPALPVAWTHAQLVGVGGSLYLLGGLEGDTFVPRGDSFRLRPGEETWEPLAPMPAGFERGAAAIVSTPGHIFLFGGDAPGGVTDTILEYVIADDEWRVLPQRLPTARSHAAAMRTEEGTFVIAGGVGIQGPLADAHALLPGGTWEIRAAMTEPHGGCAYGTIYGQLVCAGGETVRGGMVVPSRTVEVYDPTLDEWTVSTEMPLERAGAAGAVVTSRLYVAGGSQSPALEPTSSLFELDLLDTF